MMVAVLYMGAAFIVIAGGWFVVSYLLIPRDQVVVPYPPQGSFASPPASLIETSDAGPDNIDKECVDFFDQGDAQRYYLAQGGPTRDPDELDLDKDGQACENYPYKPAKPKPTLEPGSRVKQ